MSQRKCDYIISNSCHVSVETEQLPVTVDTGSQVSILKLNGKLHELSLRDTPPVYFSQDMAPLTPSKGSVSVTVKVKEEPLDVSVNEQHIRPLIPFLQHSISYIPFHRWVILTMILPSSPLHLQTHPSSLRKRGRAGNALWRCVSPKLKLITNPRFNRLLFYRSRLQPLRSLLSLRSGKPLLGLA